MAESSCTRIIVDTDLDTDCDDVGALAVLHALQTRGEAEVLAVVCSIPYAGTVGCAAAMNRYYGRPDIPIGLLRSEDLEESPRFSRYRQHLASMYESGWRRYNDVIAAEFGTTGAAARAADAVELYRRTLAAEADHSITIVAIGLLTALDKLLRSKPDDHSPLDGSSLVERKVQRLVTMGLGAFPRGKDGFNWAMDGRAAETVLHNWPTLLAVSETGSNILTGENLATLKEPHPVRRAYELYLGGVGKSRSSWDQLALLCGVRGTGGLFEELTGHEIR
ncbi:MAG: hypothetical protein GVY29_03870, partial [Spirochaetes bacterium]|nr:hypothetical protein [Spirochaetota bacterium]